MTYIILFYKIDPMCYGAMVWAGISIQLTKWILNEMVNSITEMW